MQEKIISALEDYCFPFDDELLIDAVFWLANHVDTKNNNAFIEWLDERNVCSHCGGWLEPISINEVHYELEERPTEKVYLHRKCSDCDMTFD